ncbi:hypothetical protein IG631_05130 [Alternaria alternata]|nr:hypothetical protein IG631_05130 [Alternaria alternata]
MCQSGAALHTFRSSRPATTSPANNGQRKESRLTSACVNLYTAFSEHVAVIRPPTGLRWRRPVLVVQFHTATRNSTISSPLGNPQLRKLGACESRRAPLKSSATTGDTTPINRHNDRLQ